MTQPATVSLAKQPLLMPGRLPVLGHLPQLARRPLEFFREVAGHGGVVTVRLGPAQAYVINDPDLLHAMLVKNSQAFDKGMHMAKAAQVIGNSLPVSSGGFHRHQRKLTRPVFQTARLREYFDIMLDCTLARLATWSVDTDVYQDVRTLAGTIAARSLFSALGPEQAAGEVVRLVDTVSSLITRRMLDPTGLLEKLPLASNRRFDRARRRLRAISDGFVRDYRVTGTDRHDLLSALLAARDDESDEGMTDQQLSDEANGFLIAGAEATGQALRWTLHALSEHPEIRDRVYEEVDTVLSGRLVTFDDLDRLDYTRRVITESLRLYPPVYVGSRRPIRDIRLGDYHLPAGSMVLFCAFAVHRDPNIHPDPDRFDPDRWLPERAEQYPVSSYLPFGAGFRACIGERFAMVEMLTVLATVVQRWQLDKLESAMVRPTVASFILSPSANGVRLRHRQPIS